MARSECSFLHMIKRGGEVFGGVATLLGNAS